MSPARCKKDVAGNYPDNAVIGANGGYLHPAQDEEEHPPHPVPRLEAPADAPSDDLPMPKRDMSLSFFFEPHFSQATSGC